MARQAIRNTQGPTDNSQQPTGPRRTASTGFMQAQRVTNPPQRFTNPPQRGEMEDIERGEIDSMGDEVQANLQQPTTKTGYPDRRFKGQRDLPPPQEEATTPRARTGGVLGNQHVTIDGKPDRRFKENRALSEEEAHRQWVENLQSQLGGGRGGQRR